MKDPKKNKLGAAPDVHIETTGHPNGLYTLFFSEMWERFCYYGMRVLLTLYLVKSLMKGDAEASLLYGAYTGLVYAAPILGGKMADKFLGYRWAVLLGALLMAIGEFIILAGTEQALIIGMGALIIGNGYFKANISTIVGKLYEDGDPRRDSGFTIFYIGINVGALLATTVVAYVGETYGFDKGFGLAGLGMLTGLFIFWSGRKHYSKAEGLEVTEAGRKKVFGGLNMAHIISLGSVLLIPVCYILIFNNSWLDYLFLGLFLYIAYSMITAGAKEDKAQGTAIWKDRMIALLIFMVINITFWACFEQAGTSLTLFADRNVDRSIFGWTMPASMTQFFNPFFIIVFGSIFSQMWIYLSKKRKNPNIPLKFAYGIFQLALGFLVTYIGFQMSEDNLVPLVTIILLYLFHTTGELFLSPIGLSMVTKLSPKKMAGTAMGAWFLSFAIANFVGGKIAAITGGSSQSNAPSAYVLPFSTTLDKACTDVEGVDFESWPSMAAAELKKPYELPKNISYGQWRDVLDWVEVREALASGVDFDSWINNRSANDTFGTVSSWLVQDNWRVLGQRYSKLAAVDLNDATGDFLSPEDWKYYRGSIAQWKDRDLSLEAALASEIDQVQSNSLHRYIDIFTKIGFVLIAISLIIVLFNKKLEKLMHGVV